jgi:hypothetical protein
MKKLRKRKFVVWLHNHADSRDDEWVVVWARSPEEARKEAGFDSSRFSCGNAQTATSFRKENGFGA